MTPKTIFIVVAIAITIFVLHKYTNDPHHTQLPLGTGNLTAVQEKLNKLPDNERALVEAYVKRSGGDVIPAQFADPDDPLTARTFGEAIKLQIAWEAKMKVVNAEIAARRAQREAKLAPLRALVLASVVKAEIITRNEYQARKDAGFYQRPYKVDTSPFFVLLIRIQNLGDEPIVAVRGSLEAKDSQAYLPLDLCWINVGAPQEIPVGGHIEFNCGHDNRAATLQQQDFVNNSEGRFRVEWEPQYVRLASGLELESGK